MQECLSFKQDQGGLEFLSDEMTGKYQFLCLRSHGEKGTKWWPLNRGKKIQNVHTISRIHHNGLSKPTFSIGMMTKFDQTKAVIFVYDKNISAPTLKSLKAWKIDLAILQHLNESRATHRVEKRLCSVQARWCLVRIQRKYFHFNLTWKKLKLSSGTGTKHWSLHSEKLAEGAGLNCTHSHYAPWSKRHLGCVHLAVHSEA